MKEIDPDKTFSDIVMFGGFSNVQLLGRLLKVHYPKLKVICGVEHGVIIFNDVSKIPIVNQTISAHKMIRKKFGLVYITSFIPYLNPNHKSFTI